MKYISPKKGFTWRGEHDSLVWQSQQNEAGSSAQEIKIAEAPCQATTSLGNTLKEKFNM